MSQTSNSGPKPIDMSNRPVRNASPGARQAAREASEAAALEELESKRRQRQLRSAQLRKLREEATAKEAV